MNRNGITGTLEPIRERTTERYTQRENVLAYQIKMCPDDGIVELERKKSLAGKHAARAECSRTYVDSTRQTDGEYNSPTDLGKYLSGLAKAAQDNLEPCDARPIIGEIYEMLNKTIPERGMGHVRYNSIVRNRNSIILTALKALREKGYMPLTPQESGLEPVVGDQHDPNISNPVEEKPTILFGGGV